MKGSQKESLKEGFLVQPVIAGDLIEQPSAQLKRTLDCIAEGFNRAANGVGGLIAVAAGPGDKDLDKSRFVKEQGRFFIPSSKD